MNGKAEHGRRYMEPPYENMFGIDAQGSKLCGFGRNHPYGLQPSSIHLLNRAIHSSGQGRV
jgi:hypothetical protein